MEELEDSFVVQDLFKMLDYEKQIFLDVMHKDGLVIAAKGLSMDVVLLNLFKVHCDPANLLIVLNCSDYEEKYFVEKLNDPNVHTTTFTTNTVEREDVYLSGGIHFITTRILVVDMLKKRLPIDKITGFIILRAHTVMESCQEAFVLRLFRQHNKTGFIKAFSNSAQSFTVGYGHVERVMRTIFVKELYIWPRFHTTVIETLKAYKPDVIELNIPISDTMTKIQTSLLDLMNLTVKELRVINRTVEIQEITVENCLVKKFHKILQSQLDCIWHQLSSKSKQLIADLRILRHLLILLFYTDPITFYANLITYRTMEYAKTSLWVFHQPAELLFTHAQGLVFSGEKELNPEHCPKWKAFLEILRVEIPQEIKKYNRKENTVLVLTQDSKTCFQLKQFLSHGPNHYLFLMALIRDLKFKTVHHKFDKCKDLSQTFSQSQLSAKSPKKTKINDSEDGDKNADEQEKSFNDMEEFECTKNSYILTMSQSILGESSILEEEHDDNLFEPFPEMENMNLTQILDSTRTSSDLTILIQSFKQGDHFTSLQRTLEDVKPNYIVMYHCDVTAIRQIELHVARRIHSNPLKIYFLIHTGTVEEQSYLTSLRREKEAFEFLIKTKSTIVVPDDQDGKSDQYTLLQIEKQTPEPSTRQGGKCEKTPEKHILIVDMREFRSELPALVHKRGIDIEPLTITVGDYILTRDICVERKSISDLIGSLNSGRLYQQCTQMSRYYTKPMLLIEFDQNRPFSWDNNLMVSNDVSSFDIQQKLLLLTLHFPKIKLIWSPSPYASAQLFYELKENKEQPDIQYATAIGNEEDIDLIETKYNSAIYDFVQKLPGINSKNIDAFLRKYKNFGEVFSENEDKLLEVLGNNQDTQAFYSILHNQHDAPSAQTQPKEKIKTKTKFKYTRGRGKS